GGAFAAACGRAASRQDQSVGIGAVEVQRSGVEPPRVSGGFCRGRVGRSGCRGRERLSAVAPRHRWRGDRCHREAGGPCGSAMPLPTPANQLTLLRMFLIPAFVILVVYGYLGSALVVFVTAGLTDALDGLIARRSGQKTTLGAWLDPMADKLLLVTTFIV